MKLSFFSDDDGDDGEVSDDEDDFGVMTVQSWNLFDGRVSLTDSDVSGTSLTLSLILFRPVFNLNVFPQSLSHTDPVSTFFPQTLSIGVSMTLDNWQMNLGSLFSTNFTTVINFLGKNNQRSITFCSCCKLQCIELHWVQSEVVCVAVSSTHTVLTQETSKPVPLLIRVQLFHNLVTS